MNYRFVFIASSLLVAATSLKAQVLSASKAESSFFSETPVENISATNNKVKALLNPAKNEVAIKMDMTDFSFPNKLRQEHFNENYLESEKYPSASFQGVIAEKIDWTKPGTYPVTAKGTLDVHGVKQARTLMGKVTVEPGKITLLSDFTVPLEAHHITVPKLVMMKIAEQISVKNKVEFVTKG